MAQPGRAQRSGRWGRWFKSSRPDHFTSNKSIVIQDIHEYEQTQESLALLKILAQIRKSLNKGDVRLAADVFNELKTKMKDDSTS